MVALFPPKRLTTCTHLLSKLLQIFVNGAYLNTKEKQQKKKMETKPEVSCCFLYIIFLDVQDNFKWIL